MAYNGRAVDALSIRISQRGPWGVKRCESATALDESVIAAAILKRASERVARDARDSRLQGPWYVHRREGQSHRPSWQDYENQKKICALHHGSKDGADSETVTN